VLHWCGKKQRTAREGYRAFVEKGITLGRRKDLIGGGLIRSYQGWRPSQEEERVKGDERILGSSAFVLDVLRQAEERWEQKYRLQAQGIGFDAVLEKVSALLNCTPDEILSTGKYRSPVAARSLLCYFLVRDLGMTATALAQKLSLSQPAVTMAVARGERLAKERGLSLVSLMGLGSERFRV